MVNLIPKLSHTRIAWLGIKIIGKYVQEQNDRSIGNH